MQRAVKSTLAPERGSLAALRIEKEHKTHAAIPNVSKTIENESSTSTSCSPPLGAIVGGVIGIFVGLCLAPWVGGFVFVVAVVACGLFGWFGGKLSQCRSSNSELTSNPTKRRTYHNQCLSRMLKHDRDIADHLESTYEIESDMRARFFLETLPNSQEAAQLPLPMKANKVR